MTRLQKHQVLAHLLRDTVHDGGTLANTTLGREPRPPRELVRIHP